MRLALRILIAALAAFGLVGAGAISLNHLNGAASCPQLGVLPICYVVLAGYAAILVSAFTARRRSLLFIAGWAPVLGFALVGAGAELALGDICPRDGAGMPQCFYSLALALGLGAAHFLSDGKERSV